MRGAQAGSVSDFEALFRAHWPRAYRAAYLVVHDAGAAEDLAQEAFLAAVRALDRFDSGRPFGPWLHRIVVNRAIDWVRARALRREVGAGEGGPPPTWIPEVPETLSLAELAASLPGGDLTPELVRRTVDLGLVELPGGAAGPEADVVVRSPAFLPVGRELSALAVQFERVHGGRSLVGALGTVPRAGDQGERSRNGLSLPEVSPFRAPGSPPDPSLGRRSKSTVDPGAFRFSRDAVTWARGLH